MARFLVALVIGLLLTPTGVTTAAEVCTPPRCIDARVPVPANLKVPENRVRVLLPEGYHADACRRWPVLYLLHGVGDDWSDWSERSDVVQLTRHFPVIVVMPDGGKTPDAGWYSDWVDGSRQWETFHTRVLVSWVDATFRTRGDGYRMVAGFSMGGFGAMKYAARHPKLFAAAASFSGFLDTMYAFPLEGPGYAAAKPYAGTPDDRVWGNQVQNEATWREQNPKDLAENLAGTALFVYSGMEAPGGQSGDDPQKSPNYATEHYIFQTNLSFTRTLDAAGVPYTSDFHPGYHDWPYYQAGLQWALPQMMARVGGGIQASAGCGSAAIPAAGQTRDSGQGVSGAAGANETLPASGGEPDRAAALTLVLAAYVSWRLGHPPTDVSRRRVRSTE